MKRSYFRLPTWATLSAFTLAARVSGTIIAAAALFWLPDTAQATSPGVLTVGSDIEFSDGQAPASGTKPWIVMTITDNGPNSVIFKLTTPHLTGSENIKEFDFNLDPALANMLGHISFTNLISTGSFDPPTISQGENAFKADGDGYYDLQLMFTTGGNLSKTFSSGDAVQYTINGTGLTAASFDFLSLSNNGDKGPFITAAHIQNTTGAGSGGSGWVADTTGGSFHNEVPEPSSLVLTALSCLGGLWFVRPRSLSKSWPMAKAEHAIAGPRRKK